MLSLNQTFDDTRAIKVLVVPIGENSLFESHYNTVSRLKDLPLYELNKPSSWKSQNPAFKSFDWSNGNLLFEYFRYDRIPHGPGDLDNFQCSKRVLMIMGLVNYPECNKATNIDEELKYFSRRHSNVVLCRVFVFNYTFEPNSVPIQRPKSDPDALVVFPPEGLCEGGSMVAVHLKEVMSHASVRIIESLERQMRECEEARAKSTIPASIPLSTQYDEIEIANDNDPIGQSNRGNLTWANRKQMAVKKRLPERLRKWMGDLCLQVCSPIDAIEHYSASITEARVTGKGASAGDCLWLAGALEGFIASTLILFKLNLPIEEILSKEIRVLMLSQSSFEDEPPSLAAKVMMLIEERAVEALSLYSKNIIFCAFEVECSLRLARAQEFNTTLDKERKVLEYVMRAASVPGLNPQQQIECVLEGGLICRKMSLNRKYALLLFVAAVMSADCDNAQLAYALMRKACEQYGIAVPADNIFNSRHRVLAIFSRANSQVGTNTPHNTTDNDTATATSSTTVTLEEQSSNTTTAINGSDDTSIYVQDPQSSWACLRKALFGYAANSAKQCQDNAVAIRFVSALLRLMLRVEASNVSQFGAWLSVLEQYLNGDILQENATQMVGGSFAVPSQEEFKPLASHKVQSFSGVEHGHSHDMDESRHGHHPPPTQYPQYSAAPVIAIVPSTPALSVDGSLGTLTASSMSSAIVPGRRPGRLSIASLRDFDLQNSISANGRFLSMSGAPTSSSISSAASPSLLQPIAALNSNGIFNHQYNAPGQLGGIASGAAGGVGGLADNFAKRIIDSDPAAGLRDIVYDSAEVLKSGLRRISTPSLPPKLISAVMDKGQHLRNRIRSRYSQATQSSSTSSSSPAIMTAIAGLPVGSAASSPLNGQARPISWRVTDEVPNAFDSNSANNTNYRRDYFLSSGGIEETIQALHYMLEGCSVPMDYQDQAFTLLEDIAKYVHPGWNVDLPLMADTCRPCLLPISGCRPIKLTAESSLLSQLVAQRREAIKQQQENESESYEPVAVSTNANSDTHPNHKHDHNSYPIPKKSGALYYDPFAAQRAKDVKKRKVAEVVWSVGVVGTVILLVNNPLAVPQTFDSISVLAEGVSHLAFERGAVIPPYVSNYEIRLTLKPLDIGLLTVTGIKLFISNAVHIIKVSANGKCIDKYGTEMTSSWSFPYTVMNSNNNYNSNISTKLINNGTASNSSSGSNNNMTNIADLSDSFIGIETTVITIVNESIQFKLLPIWTDCNFPQQQQQQQQLLLQGQQSGIECNNTVSAPNIASNYSSVSTFSNTYYLPLLQGECRRETIRFIENIIPQRRINKQITISHYRINVIQSYRNSNKTQTFTLKQFGIGSSSDVNNSNSNSNSANNNGGCFVRLISIPDIDSLNNCVLGELSSLDIEFEFGNFREIANSNNNSNCNVSIATAAITTTVSSTATASAAGGTSALATRSLSGSAIGNNSNSNNNNNYSYLDVESFRFEVEVLASSDTDIEELALSDIEERNIVLYCRRCALHIIPTVSLRNDSIELTDISLVGTAQLVLEIHNGSALDVCCGTGQSWQQLHCQSLSLSDFCGHVRAGSKGRIVIDISLRELLININSSSSNHSDGSCCSVYTQVSVVDVCVLIEKMLRNISWRNNSLTIAEDSGVMRRSGQVLVASGIDRSRVHSVIQQLHCSLPSLLETHYQLTNSKASAGTVDNHCNRITVAANRFYSLNAVLQPLTTAITECFGHQGEPVKIEMLAVFASLSNSNNNNNNGVITRTCADEITYYASKNKLGLPICEGIVVNGSCERNVLLSPPFMEHATAHKMRFSCLVPGQYELKIAIRSCADVMGSCSRNDWAALAIASSSNWQFLPQSLRIDCRL